MTRSPRADFLRRVLLADALASLAVGLLLLLTAGPLQAWLLLPAGLMHGAGAMLVPYAGFVLWLLSRSALPRAGVLTVIAINALWVLDSVVLLLGGFVAPSGPGIAFVLAQAAIVAVLAELQVIGLRRQPPVTA